MKTKIALIADIHGNLTAFNAILNDISDQNIQNIIIAGDIITDCPDSNEILNKIRHMNCTVIKGNREQYYLDHKAGLKEYWNNLKQTSSLIWSFKRLSDNNIHFIELLKKEAVITIGGFRIKVVHGSPDSISEQISPIEKKNRYIDIMKSLEEDILICGHSHEQWHSTYANKHAINPGAAGVHFNTRKGAEYSILEFDDKNISVVHKQIPYSIEDLETRFKQSGLLEQSPLWSEAILESIKRGENLSMQLLSYALGLMEQKGIKNNKFIPDEIWEKAGAEYLVRS